MSAGTGVAAEPDACAELIRRCGYLPLALAIVATRAASYPDFPLQLLAEELRDERSQLDAAWPPKGVVTCTASEMLAPC
jgi:hypothetical protein